MEKTVIFGGGGFIGSKLRERYPSAVAPSGDIADAVWVASVLETEKPTIVINAAGKTGKPNVDWCEDHKMETLRSNVTGPLVLLEECTKRGIYLAHIGSGCIYTDPSPAGGFTEEDEPNFTGSFYSLTKLMSDQLLKWFPVLQVRLRMPFDDTPGPRNLLTKLLKYPKVLDVQNSITYIPDLLNAIESLITKKAIGIYNVVNPGSISPYQIVERYRELVDQNHKVERLTLEGLSGVVRADRSNCVLSGEKLKSEGITMLPVAEAVDRVIKNFGASK